jgi:hypothetical protein
MSPSATPRIVAALVIAGFWSFADPGVACAARDGPTHDSASLADADPDDASSNQRRGDERKGPSRGRELKSADMSPVPADDEAERTAMEALGEGFSLRRTNHYSVLYDTGEDEVRAFGRAIEQTYRSCVNYALRLDIPTRPPKKKLLIFYFEEHAAYSAHSRALGKGERPESTPGVYFPDINRSMFFNFRNQGTFKQMRESAQQRIEALREELRRGGISPADRQRIAGQIAQARQEANRSRTVGGDLSESIVQHEVAHQVLWNIGFHQPNNFFANPRWLAEGTAMMFEPISTGSSANFGALNRSRLEEYRMMLEADSLIPLRDFLGTHEWFASPQSIGVAYAQAWALTHYLNRSKRRGLKKYVEIINRRPDDYETTPQREIDDFEKAFGSLDDRWIQRWRKWMTRIK